MGNRIVEGCGKLVVFPYFFKIDKSYLNVIEDRVVIKIISSAKKERKERGKRKRAVKI